MKKMVVATSIAWLWATAAVAQTTAWQIEDKTSALDGARSYVASIKSDDSAAGILGQPKKAMLAFSCDSRGFFATIAWPDFVQKEDPGDFSVTVVWKLDDSKPMQNSWTAMTDAVGQVGNSGLSTLKTWAAGHKLIVRVPDHHGGQDITFSLDGIADVYATLSQRNCG